MSSVTEKSPFRNSPQRAALSEIRRAIALLLEAGRVYELRVLNTRRATVSGYFSDFDKLGLAAANLSGRGPAVYVTINPVNPDLLARAANRVLEYARSTTSDADIVHRRWLLIDFDAKRPAGISSTDAEHNAAVQLARECRDWLKLQGWPGGILADSGNGGHLLYQIDLPNDDASRKLVELCLKALSFSFDNEAVFVDVGNFNAARIWKLYGTLVAKGDNIPERPHRLARILEPPETFDIVSLDLLKALAAQVPQQPAPPARRPYRGGAEPFDLEKWLAQHQVAIRHIGAWNGGTKWVLQSCVWNPEHGDKSAFIVRFPNGALAAGCHHNGCQGLGWRELREVIEPGYSRHSGAYKRHGRIFLPPVTVSQ